MSDRKLSSYCDDKETLFWRRLKALGFTADDIREVIEVLTGTCNDCWDAERGCQCWNDE